MTQLIEWILYIKKCIENSIAIEFKWFESITENVPNNGKVRPSFKAWLIKTQFFLRFRRLTKKQRLFTTCEKWILKVAKRREKIKLSERHVKTWHNSRRIVTSAFGSSALGFCSAKVHRKTLKFNYRFMCGWKMTSEGSIVVPLGHGPAGRFRKAVLRQPRSTITPLDTKGEAQWKTIRSSLVDSSFAHCATKNW